MGLDGYVMVMIYNIMQMVFFVIQKDLRKEHITHYLSPILFNILKIPSFLLIPYPIHIPNFCNICMS